MAAMTAQLYLLNARTLMDMAEHVDGDAKTKARIRFAVQQFVDASSPSKANAMVRGWFLIEKPNGEKLPPMSASSSAEFRSRLLRRDAPLSSGG